MKSSQIWKPEQFKFLKQPSRLAEQLWNSAEQAKKYWNMIKYI